ETLTLFRDDEIWMDRRGIGRPSAGMCMSAAGRYTKHSVIVVEVLKIAAHRRDGLSAVVVSHSVSEAHFFESAVALVQEQEIALGVIRDEHIQPTVLVDIGDSDSHPLAAESPESRAIGYILEPAAAEIAIEPLRYTRVRCWTAINLLRTAGASAVALG